MRFRLYEAANKSRADAITNSGCNRAVGKPGCLPAVFAHHPDILNANDRRNHLAE